MTRFGSALTPNFTAAFVMFVISKLRCIYPTVVLLYQAYILFVVVPPELPYIVHPPIVWAVSNVTLLAEYALVSPLLLPNDWYSIHPVESPVMLPSRSK